MPLSMSQKERWFCKLSLSGSVGPGGPSPLQTPASTASYDSKPSLKTAKFSLILFSKEKKSKAHLDQDHLTFSDVPRLIGESPVANGFPRLAVVPRDSKKLPMGFPKLSVASLGSPVFLGALQFTL